MITRFNDFNIPDLNSVSKEFWKMTTVVGWKKVIEGFKKNPYTWYNTRDIHEIRKEISDKAKGRLCTNYTYDEINKFDIEYYKISNQLHDYFQNIRLNNKYSDFMPGDDGFSDLISSIIGRGKFFTKKCINDIKVFLDMAKNHDYVENFGYLFNIDEEEYIKTKEKYDPLFRDVRKYNL